MPYSRREYYKIGWLRGKSTAAYADKGIDIQENALLFATAKIPYHWLPADSNQTGMFCIFTPAFLSPANADVALDEMLIFQPGQLPVFQLADEEVTEIEDTVRKKVLKETTGSATTELISTRIIQEAKILLRQTHWSVADILARYQTKKPTRHCLVSFVTPSGLFPAPGGAPPSSISHWPYPRTFEPPNAVLVFCIGPL